MARNRSSVTEWMTEMPSAVSPSTVRAERRPMGLLARAGAAIGVLLGLDGPRKPQSAYEGGRRKRSDIDWMPKGEGPNRAAELGEGGRERLVHRSRDLRDNNPLIDGAVETFIDNVIGTGIDDIEPDTGDADLDEQISRCWEHMCHVDPQRSMSLRESQELFLGEVVSGGECGVRWVIGPKHRGMPAGPAIELIETERVPMRLTGQAANGNYVRQGVEYTPEGLIVAYYVTRHNPADANVLNWKEVWGEVAMAPIAPTPSLERVSVESMDLAFMSRRKAQLRGIPLSNSAIPTIRMEDAYQDNVMLLAQTAAAMGAYGELPGDLDLFTDESGNQALMIDGLGNPVSRIEAGSFGFVRPGTKLTFQSPNIPGPNFESTSAVLQRRMSRAFGMSYANLTGDSSRSNFSSMRGDSLSERKRFRRWQEFVYQHHTAPFRKRLIDWWVLAGKITLTPAQSAMIAQEPERMYKCTIGYPGWEYVNPSQESQANKTDIESGVRSPVEVIAERGGSWKRTLRQTVKFAAERKKLMEAANVTESDMPGATRRENVVPSADPNAPADPAAAGDDTGLDDGSDDAGEQPAIKGFAEDDAGEQPAARGGVRLGRGRLAGVYRGMLNGRANHG